MYNSTMHTLRPEAEELRRRGYSYKLIEEKLGISRATMSYWFKDKPFTPNAEVLARIKTGPAIVGVMRHNARVKEIQEQKNVGIQEIGTLSKRDLLMLGIGLYIGEGAKSAEIIRVSNADPAVILLSIKWFREVCGLEDDNLTIRLHLYPDNDEILSMQYWKKITGLPGSSFKKSSIDSRTDKRVAKQRKLPYGTAHVTVVSNGDPDKGRRLFRKINGWMSGALNNDVI